MAVDPLPPHSQELEEAVLGSLMVDPTAIPIVSAILGPEDFYLARNADVYGAILELGEDADALTISERLKAHNAPDAGDISFLTGLLSAVPTALNVETYARQVADLSVRRSLIRSASEVARLAWDEKECDDTLPAKCMNLIGVAAHLSAHSKAVTKAEAVERWKQEFTTLLDSGVMPGVPTGIREIDYKLGGLKPGKLYIVAGPPGGGKTTMMMSWMLNAARRGVPVAFVSCEMDETELVELAIANVGGAKYADLNLLPGHVVNLDDDRKARLRYITEEAAREVKKLPIEFVYRPSLTPAEFRHLASGLIARKGVKVVVVDYVQIASADRRGRDVNREREVASIAEDLKRMAGVLGIAIVAGSQLNDSGEVRESRAIEQHCDVLIVLEKMESATALKAKVRKNRRGETGDISLFFKKEHATIRGVGA